MFAGSVGHGSMGLPAPRPRICSQATEWPVICGIQGHLPAWRPGEVGGGEGKARGGPKAHIPLLKEEYTEGTCPLLPRQLGSSSGGRALPLSSCCPPLLPPTAAAVPAPSISSQAGWKEEDEGRGGLSGVSR